MVALCVSGCLADAPRGNPLDPASDAFEEVGALSGRAIRYYPPYTGVEGARVRLEPAGLTTVTAADGSFSFERVPVGTQRVVAEKDGFAEAGDTVAVLLGERTIGIDLRLDGLPEMAGIELRTVHVSRWWPQDDLYLLEAEARVVDPDGEADVSDVVLELPDFDFATRLREAGPGRFMGSVPEDSLSTRSLHALLGYPVYLRIADHAGASVHRGPLSLARVIDQTPVAEAPQGLETVSDPRPVFTWQAVSLPYPFTFRVDVVRVETNIQTVVASIDEIPATETSVRPRDPLATGTYYWTVSIVDAFGNRSRSKEAGFTVP